MPSIIAKVFSAPQDHVLVRACSFLGKELSRNADVVLRLVDARMASLKEAEEVQEGPGAGELEEGLLQVCTDWFEWTACLASGGEPLRCSDACAIYDQEMTFARLSPMLVLKVLDPCCLEPSECLSSLSNMVADRAFGPGGSQQVKQVITRPLAGH